MKKHFAIMLVGAALFGAAVVPPAVAQNGQQGDDQHERKRPVGPIVREDKGGKQGGDRPRDRDRGGRDGGDGGRQGGKRDKPPKDPNFD